MKKRNLFIGIIIGIIITILLVGIYFLKTAPAIGIITWPYL